MMFKRIASVVLASCVAGLVSAAYSGRVFVDKNGNNQYDKGERLLSGVSVSDGLNVVQTDKDGRFDLTGHESEIILATSADGVIAVDREMLEVKWRFKPGKSLIYTAPSLDDPASSLEGSPVWSGETIYIGASDGVLYALNRKTGKLQWKHEFGSAVLGTVAVSGNMLFAADFAGNVYGFVGDESSTKSK